MQHRNSTRSTAMLQNKLHVFVARDTRGPLAINKLSSDAQRAHASQRYSGVFDRES